MSEKIKIRTRIDETFQVFSFECMLIKKEEKLFLKCSASECTTLLSVKKNTLILGTNLSVILERSTSEGRHTIIFSELSFEQQVECLTNELKLATKIIIKNEDDLAFQNEQIDALQDHIVIRDSQAHMFQENITEYKSLVESLKRQITVREEASSIVHFFLKFTKK